MASSNPLTTCTRDCLPPLKIYCHVASERAWRRSLLAASRSLSNPFFICSHFPIYLYSFVLRKMFSRPLGTEFAKNGGLLYNPPQPYKASLSSSDRWLVVGLRPESIWLTTCPCDGGASHVVSPFNDAS